VLVDGDPATGQGGSPGSLGDLQDTILDLHGVVAVDDAFVLDREDALQTAPGRGQEGAAPLGRRDREAAVKLPDIVVPQELIGLFRRGDSAQA
jgi:hypothetical protein